MARGLTRLQLEFAREYAVDLNGTAALMRARKTLGLKGKAKTAAKDASHLVRLGKVMAAAREFQREQWAVAAAVGVTPESVIKLFEESAFADHRKAYDEKGVLRPLSEIPDAIGRNIISIKTDEIYEGTGKKRKAVGVSREVRFTDKQRDREMLAKHLGLFKDQVEHSGEMNFNFLTGLDAPPGSELDGGGGDDPAGTPKGQAALATANA